MTPELPETRHNITATYSARNLNCMEQNSKQAKSFLLLHWMNYC